MPERMTMPDISGLKGEARAPTSARISSGRVMLGLVVSLVAGTFAASVHVPAAHAELGGKVSTLDTDRRVLKATASHVQKKAYAVTTLATDDGGLVREFSASDGLVFAVSWRGPIRPNLKTLLGDYFARFQAVNGHTNRPRLRHGMAVSDPGLIVRSGGHPGSFWGYALLPGHKPADFDLSELTGKAQ